jgi:hypothetical protein
MKGYALLFARRIFGRPLGTYKLLRMFGRHMKKADLLKLLWSPFQHRTLSRKPDLPARMMELGLEEPERGVRSITGTELPCGEATAEKAQINACR